MPSAVAQEQVRELIEYPTESVLLKPTARLVAGLPAGERVRRFARINPGLRFGLPELLDIADTVFAGAADAAGAHVPDYHWGKARIPNIRSALQYMHPGLPRGYGLVSSMEIIPDGYRPPADSSLAIQINACLGGLTTHTEHGTFQWYEGNHTQFLTSRTGLHLIDNEPLICPA